jgi:hypothetical protein
MNSISLSAQAKWAKQGQGTEPAVPKDVSNAFFGLTLVCNVCMNTPPSDFGSVQPKVRIPLLVVNA